MLYKSFKGFFIKLCCVVYIIQTSITSIYAGETTIDLFGVAVFQAKSQGEILYGFTTDKKSHETVLSIKNVVLQETINNIITETVKKSLGTSVFKIYQYTLTPAELRIVYKDEIQAGIMLNHNQIKIFTSEAFSTPPKKMELNKIEGPLQTNPLSPTTTNTSPPPVLTAPPQIAHSFKSLYQKLSEGDQWLQKQKYDHAEDIYKNLLMESPDFFPAAFHLALLYQSIGNEDGMVVTLKNTLEIYPEHTEALFKLAEIYLKRSQLTEARTLFEKVLEINKYHDGARLNIAFIKSLDPRAKGEGIAALSTMVNTTLLNDYATYLLKENRYDDAIIIYQALTVLQPDNPDFHYGLAYIYQQKQDIDRATTYYNKVIELDSKYYNAYYNLGTLYLDAGQKDLALRNLEQYAASKPQDLQPVLETIAQLKKTP